MWHVTCLSYKDTDSLLFSDLLFSITNLADKLVEIIVYADCENFELMGFAIGTDFRKYIESILSTSELMQYVDYISFTSVRSIACVSNLPCKFCDSQWPVTKLIDIKFIVIVWTFAFISTGTENQ